jgi:glutamate dehydrogenase
MGKLSFPYERGFSEQYRSLVPPRVAMRDVFQLEAVARSGRDSVDLRRSSDGAPFQIKVYGARERGLDQLMPLLQNLGLRVLDQIQFKITFNGNRFFIRVFSVEPMVDGVADLLPSKKPLLAALDALLFGQAEDDALNGLILLTGLHWKDIDLLRAYRNYCLQLGGRFGLYRFHLALLGNPAVARLLYRYFEARFEPDGRWRDSAQREVEALTPIQQELIAALDKVDEIYADRILRDLFNLIDATLRTNFYRRRDQTDHFIALKINSLGVIDMPSPKPFVEIYVHSRTMEGIHLRGAKVARGGIRWSDRPDDFRAEILDLMQTQMVKNALIAPQGAKGGFILKIACKDATECARLAQDAYVTFMRGLLDLTDNLEATQAVRPPLTVVYDDDDPYLVVAADKGTAGWSDRANDVAAEYGYWLGEAFATGGSHGYHHKQLGITARGAFVCMKRHLLELGLDIDKEMFSVVGVGSMDGDVFGNGMLLSNNIRLLGAFSADYIFLDPTPDRQASINERKRLFNLQGSSWKDYDPALISRGGGVFRRNAKDIPLSPEVRAWLGVRYSSIDGEGLMRLLLTAPVDLLWLGGIGTYVKASSEINAKVGDRANDGARVDASQLRAKVVGEGANLGFTQKARIEYALNGGHINTDAVDNSAGVDLSDHEVNLKILMATPPRHSGFFAPKDADRNRFLAELTDDVCRSVLADNYRQSLCLSLENKRCHADIEPFMELADQLEHAGMFDRSAETFPIRKEILARTGKGLTRPELAVLMAHTKLALKRALLEASDFLAGQWVEDIFAAYFPARARDRYAARLKDHALGREIAATMICNKVIDQAGAGFLVGTEEWDVARLIETVRAYITFDLILEGDRWREAVHALDGKTPTSRQYKLLLQLEDSLAFLTRWALDNGRRFSPEPDLVGEWRTFLRQYLDHLGKSAEFAVLNSTAPDASRIVFLDRLRDFPILMDLSRRSREKLGRVSQLFEEAVEFLGSRQIATLMAEVKPRDHWEKRLQGTLDSRLHSAPARLCRVMLATGPQELAAFFHQHGMRWRLASFQRLRRELQEAHPVELAPFAAVIDELDALVDACGAASENG